MKTLQYLFALCFLAQTSALLVQPRVASPALRSRAPAATMQFGGKPEREGLTRDNEPDEFFSTNMDDMSDEEKLKSPVVIGGACGGTRWCKWFRRIRCVRLAILLFSASTSSQYRSRSPYRTFHRRSYRPGLLPVSKPRGS